MATVGGDRQKSGQPSHNPAGQSDVFDLDDQLLRPVQLAEFVDLPAIQALMDDLNRLFNIGMALIDLDGNVLVASGWQTICTQYHRQHPEARKNCHESDTSLSLGVQAGTFREYRCKNNMWDISTPIIVDGIHLGNLFLGQFFYEDEVVDREIFRKQAQAFGFPKAEYLQALDAVPRWNRDKLQVVLSFFRKMGTLVSDLSYKNLKLARSLDEKRSTEAKLRRANTFLDSIVENIPMMVFIKDAKELRFVRFNKAGEQLLGYPRQALIGKNDYDFFPTEHAQFFIEKDRSVLNSKELLEIEEEPLETSDKGQRLLHTLKVPILDSSGEAEYLLGISEDITERRHAEHALQQSEARHKALAEENAALLAQSRLDAESKSILLHEVNHRVKNNLMAVIGLLYAQKRFIPDDIRSEFLSVMKDLAGRIETLAMAHNMLSAVKWQPILFSSLFDGILATCSQMVAGDRTLTYAYVGADARIPARSANSLALLLFELATNTTKHAFKEQNSVQVQLTGAWEGEAFRIEYRDNGPGYPPAFLEHGTSNLGLYLVRTLAAYDLRGEVRFRNDSGAVMEIRCGLDSCIQRMEEAEEKAHE